jgi:hypothetical protein
LLLLPFFQVDITTSEPKRQKQTEKEGREGGRKGGREGGEERERERDCDTKCVTRLLKVLRVSSKTGFWSLFQGESSFVVLFCWFVEYLY